MIVGFHLLTCPCKSLFLLFSSVCSRRISTSKNTNRVYWLFDKQDNCLEVAYQNLKIVACILYGAFIQGETIIFTYLKLFSTELSDEFLKDLNMCE